MDIQKNYLSLLQEILDQKSFDRLEGFKDVAVHQEMTDKERNLLAHLFVLQGEAALHRGDQRAQEIFEVASQVESSNAELFYRQGLAWFFYGKGKEEERALQMAYEKLMKTVGLDPFHANAFQTLGNVCAKRAYLAADPELFMQAEEAFQKAERLWMGASGQLSLVYWDSAKALVLSGKCSGEAFDYKKAVEKFQKASDLGLEGISFWEDYGHALTSMSALLSSPEGYFQASHLFEQCVEKDEERFEGWYHLGFCYHNLFEMTGSEELFNKATNAYSAACDLNPEHADMLIKWGNLLVSAGKFSYDPDVIEASLEKFLLAEELSPAHPLIYSGWSDALMLLGVCKEELCLLKEAEEKIVRGLELSQDNPEIWGSYGAILFELGRYFQDEKYYNQALQKFQYALSLDRNNSTLWLGLSRVHFAISDLRKESASADQAVFAASKAVALRGGLPQLWMNYGICLIQLAELSNQHIYVESAVEKLATALELARKEQGGQAIDCLYHYGYALDFLGDFEGDRTLYRKAVHVLSYVVSKEPEYSPARYALAMALLHLGEVTDDLDCFQSAADHFSILAVEDGEDLYLWGDWGVALLNLAYLTQDIGRPDQYVTYLEDAEGKLRHSIALGATGAYYYLACIYAMKGLNDPAMHFLEKAEASGGLPELDDLLEDEWLDGLRETEAFGVFVSRLKNQSLGD